MQETLESKLQSKFGQPATSEPTSLDAKLSDKFGQPKLASVESALPDRIASSPFMTAVAAFNHGVEEKTIGLWKRLGQAVDADLGTNLAGHVDDYMARKEGELVGLKKMNPVSAAIGDGLATIGLLAPALAAPVATTLAGSVASGAAIGAAMGTTSYDSGNSPSTQPVSGAVAGAIGGAAGYGLVKGLTKAGQMLVTTIQGSKLLTKTPDAIIDETIAASMKNSAKATPQHTQDVLNRYVARLQMQKDKLYAVRDEIAKTQNVSVQFSELTAALKNAPKELLDDSAVNSTAKLLKTANTEYNKQVPFPIAQKMMSKLGGLKDDLYKQGKGTVAHDVDVLYNAIRRDIDASATATKELKAAQNIANTFYRDTYNVIKSSVTKARLQQGFVNEKFISTFLTRTASDKTTAAAFDALNPKLKEQMVISYIKALKAEKLTSGGQFNPTSFANALKKELGQVPALSKTAIDVENIAKVAAAVGEARRGIPSQFSRGAIAAGATADVFGASGGGTATALSFNAAMKLPFLYTAGKMLAEPTAAQALVQLRNAPKLAEPIKTALTSRLAAIYAANLATAHDQLTLPEPEQQPIAIGGIRG